MVWKLPDSQKAPTDYSPSLVIIHIGAEDRITGWNTEMARHIAHGAEAILYKGMRAEDLIRLANTSNVTMFHNGQVIDIEQRLALRAKLPVTVEHLIDGRLWAQSTEAKTETGSIIINRDITGERSTLLASQHNERLLSEILDTIPINISVKDERARTVYVNRQALDMMGVEMTDVIGKTQFEVFPNDYGFKTYQDEMRVLRTGEEIPYQEATAPAYIATTANGEAIEHPPVNFYYCKVPIKNTLGQVDKVLSIAIDISERKRAEREVIDLQAQLLASQKNETIATLTNGIAHDINNILAIIQASAEVAASKMDRENHVYKQIRDILDNTRRGTKLVQQILDYARPKTDQHEVVDLEALFSSFRPMLQASIGRSIHLDVQCPPGLCCALDTNRMAQVFLNLASNAAEAMPGGGILTIDVEEIDRSTLDHLPITNLPAISGRVARIKVADNGCGIEQSHLDRIFDPFFSTKEKTNRSGTGLGLPIVRTIIQGHKGDIAVDSAPGLGTAFTILLPLSDAPATTSNNDGLPAMVVVGNGEEIVVVDDEPILAHTIAMLLEMRGFRTSCFTDAEAAYETIVAQPDRFHMVLADINMPDMTGTQMAHQLRVAGLKLPIILMAGQPLAAREQTAVGVNAYLAKPITGNEMAQAIMQALHQAA